MTNEKNKERKETHASWGHLDSAFFPFEGQPIAEG